jgi:hypothetical protein
MLRWLSARHAVAARCRRNARRRRHGRFNSARVRHGRAVGDQVHSAGVRQNDHIVRTCCGKCRSCVPGKVEQRDRSVRSCTQSPSASTNHRLTRPCASPSARLRSPRTLGARAGLGKRRSCRTSTRATRKPPTPATSCSKDRELSDPSPTLATGLKPHAGRLSARARLRPAVESDIGALQTTGSSVGRVAYLLERDTPQKWEKRSGLARPSAPTGLAPDPTR